jgi:hypothetical protein
LHSPLLSLQTFGVKRTRGATSAVVVIGSDVVVINVDRT